MHQIQRIYWNSSHVNMCWINLKNKNKTTPYLPLEMFNKHWYPEETFWEIAIEEVLKTADQKKKNHTLFIKIQIGREIQYIHPFSPNFICGVAGTARVSVHR